MTADYAGDIDAAAAWRLLAEDERAALVDVRTRPEWQFVGLPALDALGKRVRLISWQIYPEMTVNSDFVTELERAGIAPDAPVLFLCRSGGRSREAAMAAAQAGFSRAYNVAGGFEGPPDPDGHRGAIDGWKARGLPWAQN